MRVPATAVSPLYRARTVRDSIYSNLPIAQADTERSWAPAETNYPAPVSLLSGDDWTQHVTEVHAKAGDAVIFSEVRIANTLRCGSSTLCRALRLC